MRSNRTVCTAILIAVFLCTTNKAFCVKGPPEQLVHDFYLWYCNELSTNIMRHPILDKDILQYVDKRIITKLRMEYKHGLTDSDYFIKENGFWPEICNNVIIHGVPYINKNISIFYVIFRITNTKLHISIVLVERKNNSFHIIHVKQLN